MTDSRATEGKASLPDSRQGLLDGEEIVARVSLDDEDDEDDGDDDGGDGGPTPGEDPRASTLAPLRKLVSATLTLATLIGLGYGLDLQWAQPWRADEAYVPFWNLIGRELMGQGAQAQADADEAARLAALADEAEAEESDVPLGPRPRPDHPPLPEVGTDTDAGPTYPDYLAHELDPAVAEVEHRLVNDAALEPFYAALARTDIGYPGAVTRVGHWGDSVLGNDGITSAIRRRMQGRFGDAGHGFHALRRYDASYRHQGVGFAELGNLRWQSCMIRSRCRDDGSYGYGGATVSSSGGPTSQFETATKGSVGRNLSIFELWYRALPAGGDLRVRIDGGPDRGGVDHLVSTASPAPADPDAMPDLRPDLPAIVDGWARFEFPEGAHSVEVRAAGGGSVQAYGVVLEREGPGLVWDGMALIGAFTKRLLEIDPGHLRAQLQHRELDLMVFTFGGNDMTRDKGDLRRTMEPYIDEYGQVLDRFRAARPQAACLVLGPVDHGERRDGRVVSRPVAARMTAAQRQVAVDHGCAFFDTLEAMGGPGSVARWKQKSLISGDLAHPTARGHKLIASFLVQALMAGYIEFREANAGQPMPEPAPPGD